MFSRVEKEGGEEVRQEVEEEGNREEEGEG